MPKRKVGWARRVPLGQCPHCGQTVDAISTLAGQVPKPKPADMTVCLGCGEVLQFDEQLRVRKMTATEIAALTPEEAFDLKQTQAAIRDFLASET